MTLLMPTVLSLVGADFTILRKKYVIEGKLICEEPVAVGAPAEVFQLVDRPVIRIRNVDGQVVPYIPGSSLKGVLRSFAETILRTIALSSNIKIDEFSEKLFNILATKIKDELFNKGFVKKKEKQNEEATIYLIEENRLKDTLEKAQNTVRELIKKGQWNVFCCNTLASNVEQDLKDKSSMFIANVQVPLFYLPCIACQLFGGGGLASHIIIHDAFPESPDEISVRHRTCVSIDRMFRRQKPGRLFTIEFVEPGSVFKFRLEIVNLELESDKVKEFQNKAEELINKISSNNDDNKKFDAAVEFIKSLKTYIVALILKELTSGNIQVGGRKSAGLGRVRLEISKVTAYYVHNFKIVKEEDSAAASIRALISAVEE